MMPILVHVILKVGQRRAMRPCEAKRTITCSHKTKNDKKTLICPTAVTTKQIGTKNEQCCFSGFRDYQLLYNKSERVVYVCVRESESATF